MNTDKFGIGREGLDFSDSKAFQIDDVKNEPREYDISANCGSYWNSSISETGFDQEQNEMKLANNLNLESKFFDNSSTRARDSLQIKNEDDIDIFYEDVKRVTHGKKSTENYGICQVCYKCGEDMNSNVKRSSLGHTTVSGLKPPDVQDETISGYVVTKEQDSSAVPQMLSVSLTERDDEMNPRFCSKPLDNNLSVQHQVKEETNIIQCKFCEMGNLKRHERVHTGEKPFQCKLCSKIFSNMGNLNLHQRVHTGEKPFQCKLCSKSFSTMGNLKCHERVHTGEKPFHCRICSKSFRHKSNLTCHESSHTGEKLFHCKMCSKSFRLKGILTRHERSHTGEKPFHCKICSKSFTHKSNLTRHESSHTGEKPFHCKICSKSFSQKGHLTMHERVHTGEKHFIEH